MSGFEIAGVVLGAIPIVIEALSKYRAGKGLLATIRKSHGLVDQLIHRLRDQHFNFYLDILSLLREAEVHEMLMEGSDPTPERCIEILQAVQTGHEIKRYVGHLFDHFLEILRFHEKYLKEIVSKLSHIIRLPNANVDDLAAIVRASRAPGALPLLKGKARFAMDRQSLEALVVDLGTERGSLERLIRRVRTKREWEAREPTTSAAVLSQAFSRVRESAITLYRAASRCCWVCDRHESHTIMMRLGHRIPETKYRAPCASSSSSVVAFWLCVPVEDAVPQRIEVVSRCGDSLAAKKTAAVKFQREQVSLDNLTSPVPANR